MRNAKLGNHLNDLGRLVAPIFLLKDRFLYAFSSLGEKIKKSIDLKSDFFFGKIPSRILFFGAPVLSVRPFQMPFEGLL